jgi:hypothetical protein
VRITSLTVEDVTLVGKKKQLRTIEAAHLPRGLPHSPFLQQEPLSLSCYQVIQRGGAKQSGQRRNLLSWKNLIPASDAFAGLN